MIESFFPSIVRLFIRDAAAAARGSTYMPKGGKGGRQGGTPRRGGRQHPHQTYKDGVRVVGKVGLSVVGKLRSNKLSPY